MGCSRCKFQNRSKLELPCLECTHNRAIDYFMPMTNADRIRNMTDEELAEYTEELHRCPDDVCIHDCVKCNLNWLKKEVESEQ